MSSSEAGRMSPTDTKATIQQADIGVVPIAGAATTSREQIPDEIESDTETQYRVYKRRWLGLIQLSLLNIIVSWDWLSFSAVSTSSAQYFGVSENDINWLSTGFLFAFCIVSPVVIWTLNKGGPKPSIIAASVFVLVGNWIRYGGTRTKGGNFGVVVFGQIIIGLAQPFMLAAPTRYSDLWFTDRGRVSATALASLSNPFGGALGQLIDPFWVEKPGDVPNMILYVAIMSTIICIPSFFIPARPPTPPSASAAQHKVELKQGIMMLLRSIEFWLVFVAFSVYVGFFNSFSSLINQILSPYGYSETDSGICGAILIVVGLVCSAVVSPLIDRWKRYLLAIKILVPLIGICYLLFIFAPPTNGLAFPYIIAAGLGATSFSLLPIALEWLVEVTYPVSPELTSTICWTGGQFLGAIFLLIQGALRGGGGTGAWWPTNNMQRALIFEAVVSLAVVPLPLCLGLFGRDVSSRRLEVDKNGIVALDSNTSAGSRGTVA